MTQEKELPRKDGIQEILRGKIHVIVETFLLGSSGSYLDTQIVMHELLLLHGITNHDPITFWQSEGEQVQGMIESLKKKKTQRASDDSGMFIVGVSAKSAERTFNKISTMVLKKDPILEGIDGKDITILGLDAPETSRRIDMKTGVTIVTIRKGEPAFPMHPTPAS